jgi:hypothetical protein
MSAPSKSPEPLTPLKTTEPRIRLECANWQWSIARGDISELLDANANVRQTGTDTIQGLVSSDGFEAFISWLDSGRDDGFPAQYGEDFLVLAGEFYLPNLASKCRELLARPPDADPRAEQAGLLRHQESLMKELEVWNHEHQTVKKMCKVWKQIHAEPQPAHSSLKSAQEDLLRRFGHLEAEHLLLREDHNLRVAELA